MITNKQLVAALDNMSGPEFWKVAEGLAAMDDQLQATVESNKINDARLAELEAKYA